MILQNDIMYRRLPHILRHFTRQFLIRKLLKLEFRFFYEYMKQRDLVLQHSKAPSTELILPNL